MVKCLDAFVGQKIDTLNRYPMLDVESDKKFPKDRSNIFFLVASDGLYFMVQFLQGYSL